MESYRERVNRLKKRPDGRDLPVEEIHYRGRQRADELGEPSVSLSSIQKILAPGSERRPSADVLRVIAYGLGVQPNDFPEFRLAMARQALDEKAAPLEVAVARLDALEAALAARSDEDDYAATLLDELAASRRSVAVEADQAGPRDIAEAPSSGGAKDRRG